MRNFITVLKFEYLGTVKPKSFIITTALIAIILFAAVHIPMILDFVRGGDDPADYVIESVEDQPVAAFHDTTGWYTEDVFRAFDPHRNWMSVDNRRALESGVEQGDFEVGLYLYTDGLVVYMQGGNALFGNVGGYWELVRSVMQGNQMAQAGLDEGAIGTVLAVAPMMDVITIGRDAGQSYWVALVFGILLMLSITMFGAIVSQSVSTEKTSKAIELLTISTNPYSLMFGKVIAAGLAGLTLLAVIAIPTVFAMYQNLAAWQEFSPMVGGLLEMVLTSNLFGLALLFFVIGFFTYAFVYAAMSSTVSRAEDVASAQTVPALLAGVAYYVAFSAMFAPDALHVRILSYVPFFSPMVMMTRAMMTEIPLTELLLSIGASVFYILLLGFLCAKIYRIGIMLTGNKPGVRQILKLMRQS